MYGYLNYLKRSQEHEETLQGTILYTCKRQKVLFEEHEGILVWCVIPANC